MSQTIKLKRNKTNSATTPSTLLEGEIAVNILDKSLFVGDGSNVVRLYVGSDKYFNSDGYANNALKLGGNEVSHFGTAAQVTAINKSIESINNTKVTGIKMNGGLSMLPVNGVVDLGTVLTEHQDLSGYQTKITSTNKLAYSLISGTPTSLPASDVYAWAKAATKPTYTASEVGALSTSGGTIESTSYYPLILDTTKTINSAIIYSSNKVNKAQIGWNADVGTFLLNYGSNCYLGVKENGTPYYMSSSDWAFHTLYHTGNFNPANYLPKSGGTITSEEYQPLIVNSTWEGSSKDVRIALSHNGEIKGLLNWNSSSGLRLYDNIYGKYIGLTSDGTPTYSGNTLIHSGNYSSYALPLSGGTISGRLTIDSSSKGDRPLALRSNAADANGACRIQFLDSNNAFQAYVMTGWGNLILSHRSFNQIGVGDSGIWCSSDNGTTKHTLIHSGNIAKQIVEGVFAGSGIGDANTVSFTDHTLRWFSAIPSNTSNIPTTAGYQNGLLVLPLHSNGSTAQLYFSATKKLYYRSYQTYDWNEIAYVTDNVASATKLQTARTIWGQSFDGTGDISGKLYNCDFIRSTDTTNDGYYVGLASSGAAPYEGLLLYTYGPTPITMYTRGLERMRILSNGNVLIGTTNDDSSRKLQVYQSSGWAGTFKTDKSSISFAYSEGQGISLNSKSNNVGAYLVNVVYGQTTLGSGGTTAFRINDNGNVLIGTTTDNGAKLQVGGSASMSYTFFRNYENTDNVGYIGRPTSNNNIYLVNYTNSAILFATNGTVRASIEANGNVLIGTTTDNGYKLDVNGSMQLRAGDYIANRATLILNSNSGSAGDIIFKCNSTTKGNYGWWAISSRNDSTGRFSIFRGSENGATSGEAEVFTISSTGNISAKGYQLPTSAPSNPVSGGYYLYVGTLGAGATIS